MTAATTRLRDEALMMLDGKGAILGVARRITQILQREKLDGAVVGGVAVVLHGHIRTTADVDVYVSQDAQRLADNLRSEGFAFDPSRREFRYGDVPVHLVTPEQAPTAPARFEEIDKIRTVSLADLMNMKLYSGTRSLTRAQDLADIVGLIRAHQLGNEFARHILKPLRSEFRKLVKAVKREQT